MINIYELGFDATNNNHINNNNNNNNNHNNNTSNHIVNKIINTNNKIGEFCFNLINEWEENVKMPAGIFEKMISNPVFQSIKNRML